MLLILMSNSFLKHQIAIQYGTQIFWQLSLSEHSRETHCYHLNSSTSFNCDKSLVSSLQNSPKNGTELEFLALYLSLIHTNLHAEPFSTPV